MPHLFITKKADMTHYPKIWFLRHGQTEWNKAYRLQGQLDSALTQQGLADAHRQAMLMRPILDTKPALFVSPLGRAIQTADIALAGAPYKTDPRLMEIHAGQWQGRLRQDILADHPEWGAAGPTALEIYEAAEGGEGLTAFHHRGFSARADRSYCDRRPWAAGASAARRGLWFAAACRRPSVQRAGLCLCA